VSALLPGPIWAMSAGPHALDPPGHGDMVLVHGSLDRSAGLLKLSRQLDDHWRVTRYDRRGYGRSRPCEGPFTVDAQVADLVAVIGHARSDGDPPAVLFGHSFGGNVVLTVADRFPELVRAAVVYESPMSWVDWWPADSAGGLAVRAGGDPEAAAEVFMRRLIGDQRWARLPESSRQARRAEGAPMLAELADLRTGRPWRPERIGVPVLALFGEHGRPHHARAMRTLAELVPDGRARMVPGAHHFGPNTLPAVVAGMVTGFLAEAARPAG
jgi:pimeloyl-ACP methyl ester carboxylesterase